MIFFTTRTTVCIVGLRKKFLGNKETAQHAYVTPSQQTQTRKMFKIIQDGNSTNNTLYIKL